MCLRAASQRGLSDLELCLRDRRQGSTSRRRELRAWEPLLRKLAEAWRPGRLLASSQPRHIRPSSSLGVLCPLLLPCPTPLRCLLCHRGPIPLVPDQAAPGSLFHAIYKCYLLPRLFFFFFLPLFSCLFASDSHTLLTKEAGVIKRPPLPRQPWQQPPRRSLLPAKTLIS